ncbi:MAG: SDR family oxidoreductase [Bacteroidota bacterium]
MTILIIGSKGFVGSHCRKYYTALNHTVIGCDIFDSEENNYYKIDGIGFDFSALFKQYNFDVCINGAGSANVAYSYKFPEKDFELNVSLVINLLGAIKTNSPHCKFINFSSAAVYGNPKVLPINENSETNPLSPYGYHKMLSENLLMEYHRFFKLHTCSLRVFSAYGPGLKKQLFWDIFQKSKVVDTIKLFGTGNESRDFIYISDLVNAVDCVIHNGSFVGETINIASGVETSVHEAASILAKALIPHKDILFSGEVKEGDPINWRADIKKLSSFGFTPSYKIEEGLLEYYNWLVKQEI